MSCSFLYELHRFTIRNIVDVVLQESADQYEPRGRLDPAGFDKHVIFSMSPAPADLALFVDHAWIVSWDQLHDTYLSEEVMHRPFVDIFVSKDRSGVQGTFRYKRTYVASGSGRIMGVRFKPGGFHAFWSGAMTELQDVMLDLTQIFPEADDTYIAVLTAQPDQQACDQLMQLLRTKCPQPDPKIGLINQIITATESDESLQTVAAVARHFSKSERWLQQLFQEYVGIGLKWLLQRKKLVLAAEKIRSTHDPDWTALAYDLGYSSQQHFITDFKQVVGKTPTQYKRELT
jgi:AraC-like DNA-binding protein